MKIVPIAPCWLFGCTLTAVSICACFSAPAQSLIPLWSKGGHASSVSAVVCSRNGDFVVSASDDFTVKIWSTNGSLLRTVSTSPSPATCVALSPDGTKIAAGTYFGGTASGSVGRPGYSSIPGLGLVYLWQAPDGWASTNVSLVRIYTNRFGKISSLAFSADSLRLAWGNAAGSNYVCSALSPSILAARPGYNTSVGPAAVTSVALSAPGWLLSGCEDKTLRLWNSSWLQVWNSVTAHASNVTSVAFSPDGATFVSASLDNTLRLWLTNGTLVRDFVGHVAGATAVAFSPDAAKLASGSLDGSIRLWDALAGTCLASISAHEGPVNCLEFTPDSAHVLSGGEDASVRLWSATDGALVQTFGGQGFIATAAISPDGRWCASAGSGPGISLCRTADGSPLMSLAAQTNFVSALAFAPDTSMLASGGGPLEPTIKLWRLSDGALVRTITATSNGVTALAFSPDGNLLACGGDSTEVAISLFAVDGNLVRSLSGHSNGVTALAFSPDGNLLASGGRRFDQAVKVWAVTNGALLQSLEGHANNIEALAFAPDGNSLASSSSGPNNLKLWQLSEGSSRNLAAGTNAVFALGFSPDGTTLASADRDGVKFWSAATGALSETATQETFRVSSLAYSANGNLFLISREDGSLVLSANSRGALGQPPFTFTGISMGQDNHTIVGGAVQPWVRYVIESSSDLVNWVFGGWVVGPTNSLAEVSLEAGNGPAQFYRALTPP